MALRIISRNPNENIPEPNQTKKEPFVWSNTPGQVVGAALSSPGILGNIQKGLQAAAEYLPGTIAVPHPISSRLGHVQLPTTQDIRENVVNPTVGKVFPSVASKPQGVVQEALSMSAENLPLALALGGGNLVSSIGRDISSSLGIKSAEKAGFGFLGQLAGGILGSSLYGKGTAALKGAAKPVQEGAKSKFKQGSLSDLASKATKDLYAQEEKIGAKINESVPGYKEKLTKIARDIEVEGVKESDRKILQELWSAQRQNLGPSSEVNAANLTQRIKRLNKVLRANPSDDIQVIGNRLREAAKDAEKQIGKKHPEWFKTIKDADLIYKAENFKDELLHEIQKEPSAYKKFIHTPSILGLWGLANEAVFAIPKKAINESARTIRYLLGNDATRKLYMQATQNFLNDKIPQFKKDLTKLSAYADRYEKKVKKEYKSPESKGQSRLRIVGHV